MNAAGVLLGEGERQTRAEALGDTPHTVGAVHDLRRGSCRAYVIGTADRPAAAVVQSRFCRSEPVGRGTRPAGVDPPPPAGRDSAGVPVADRLRAGPRCGTDDGDRGHQLEARPA